MARPFAVKLTLCKPQHIVPLSDFIRWLFATRHFHPYLNGTAIRPEPYEPNISTYDDTNDDGHDFQRIAQLRPLRL